MFDAPIPGQSLTHELGARPWQQPAQLTNIDDVVNYYMARMTTEEFMEQLIDVLELGIPVTSLANIVQLNGVMEGKHSIDAGILVGPLLIELIMMLAESAGIDYVSGLEDPNKDKTSDIKLAKFANEYGKALENIDVEALAEDDETDVKPVGLMARRQ
tara:strand:+ start:559 stop:1032 length:474 start_codon:yes stop_codon:yes gene_type:complete